MTGSMQGMIRLACAALALAACGSSASKRALTQQEMIAADPLPLAKGSRWTYSVTVKRFDADNERETTTTLPWVTEVIDATDHTAGENPFYR